MCEREREDSSFNVYVPYSSSDFLQVCLVYVVAVVVIHYYEVSPPPFPAVRRTCKVCMHLLIN